MEHKLEQLQHQLRLQNSRICQIETILRQQSDTANRRTDATFKTLSDGFKSLNRRLDQHELIFEAIDNHISSPNELAMV